MSPIRSRGAAMKSSFWAGDPFDAPGAAVDLSTALLAAAVHHPESGVRSVCRKHVGSVLGSNQLSAAIDSVAKIIAPHNADILEPMALEEGECFVIAAVQLLAAARTGKDPVLRVTCADGPDLSGGIELTGLRRCIRVDRRLQDGAWNYARGSVFHPREFRGWATPVRRQRACRVQSESDRRHAALRIPGGPSGTSSYRAAVGASAALVLPPAAESLWFGLRELQGSSTADEAIKSCAQRHARMEGGGPSLSMIGGVFELTREDLVIRFKSAESIMRLAATASQAGAMRIPAARPMGWILFGRGEDEIDFVPSAHMSPPMWLASPGLDTLAVSPDLVVALSRWCGPFAGHAPLEFLESFR